MGGKRKRKFAISRKRMEKVRRAFFPKSKIVEPPVSKSVRHLMEAGFIRLGHEIKKTPRERTNLLRFTKAGKVRLRVLRFVRGRPFSKLDSSERVRYSIAFLTDLIHDLRLAALEEHLQRWVRHPANLRSIDPYNHVPVISDIEVKAFLKRHRKSASASIIDEGLRLRKRVDDFPDTILSQIRDRRSRDALVEYCLENWESPSYRKAVFKQAHSIWPEVMDIWRSLFMHSRWEKRG